MGFGLAACTELEPAMLHGEKNISVGMLFLVHHCIFPNEKPGLWRKAQQGGISTSIFLSENGCRKDYRFSLLPDNKHSYYDLLLFKSPLGNHCLSQR